MSILATGAMTVNSIRDFPQWISYGEWQSNTYYCPQPEIIQVSSVWDVKEEHRCKYCRVKHEIDERFCIACGAPL